MGWEEFLDFLQGPGINVVVGILLAFVAEYVAGFQKLESKHKQIVFGGLSFVVPLLGAIGSCVSGYAAWSDWVGLWWPALVAGGSAFFSGTMGHLAHSFVRKLA